MRHSNHPRTSPSMGNNADKGVEDLEDVRHGSKINIFVSVAEQSPSDKQKQRELNNTRVGNMN